MPVDGCEVPWSRAQFAFAYDSAVTENPPKSIPELIAWIKANPGQFTYPAPPDFTGSVFVRHVFYHAAGGVDNLLGDFDQAKYDAAAAKTWEILNDLEPSLWREGQTYPALDHRASAALRKPRGRPLLRLRAVAVRRRGRERNVPSQRTLLRA